MFTAVGATNLVARHLENAYDSFDVYIQDTEEAQVIFANQSAADNPGHWRS